jgi:hypothetical protein
MYEINLEVPVLPSDETQPEKKDYHCICGEDRRPRHRQICIDLNESLKSDIQDTGYQCPKCDVCKSKMIQVEFKRVMPPHIGGIMFDGRNHYPYMISINIDCGSKYTTRDASKEEFQTCLNGLLTLRYNLQKAYAHQCEFYTDRNAEFRHTKNDFKDIKILYRNLMNFCNYHICINKMLGGV